MLKTRLHVADRVALTGRVTVRLFRQDPDTGMWRLYETRRTRNLIVTVGFNFVRDVLEDTSMNAGVRFMAWGTGSTAPAAADTKLDVENGRKVVTSFTDGTVGKKTITTYLAPDDANVTIEEFGWFATSTATATADSGVLYARVLYPGGAHTKTNLESIQIDHSSTFA